MRFGYYRSLNSSQQRVYRRSDALTALPLPPGKPLDLQVARIADALRANDRAATEQGAQSLLDGLVSRLRVPRIRLEVLEVRPSSHWGELHGLYTPGSRGRRAVVTLWMRTAKRRQIVAFRTFVRTLLHELCHHLDYELLGLADSYHTEGFYKRESSLVHQLVPPAPALDPPAAPAQSRGARP